MFRSATERGDPPRVFEDGGQMRDFVHVDDVARANLLALDAVVGAAAGSATAYNVCSGRPVSILDVARLVAGSGPAPEVTGEYRLGDVRHIVASPEQARADLGFRAEIPPEDGLARFRTDPLRA
jgi:dTDP-L-rhamnose 4-epimerase